MPLNVRCWKARAREQNCPHIWLKGGNSPSQGGGREGGESSSGMSRSAGTSLLLFQTDRVYYGTRGVGPATIE